MNHFIDPPNKDEILATLELEAKNDNFDREQFREYVDRILPGWLVYATDQYSKDYPHLTNNWQRICEETKSRHEQIVLVQDIKFDNDHLVLKTVCEIMTRRGYCVRRSEEFIVCDKCLKAIPCKDVWHLLKEKGLPVPNEWSRRCKECK